MTVNNSSLQEKTQTLQHNHTYEQRPTRVVITGLGTVSPLALTMPETWQALLAGRSGIKEIASFNTDQLRTKFAGEIRDFDATNYMPRKEVRRLDRYIQYAIAATQEAVSDAKLDLSQEQPNRVGVVIGSAIGGIETLTSGQDLMNSRGQRRVSPFMIPNMLVDSACGKIAIEYNAHGPNHSVVSACASGTSASGEAFEILRRGDADIIITGGADAGVVPLTMAGFDVMGALSQHNEDPAAACRPFSADRDGFVMSEGAVTLIMETEEHAKSRNAPIYAEVIGYGSSADAYSMAAPHENGRGAVDAMQMALRKAADYGVSPSDVNYINAHGTATRLNDVGETRAIKQVFGDHAYHLSISSTKSMLGHLLGGAGAIEAAICAKAIQEGIIPPTINLYNQDPECDLNYTPLTPKEMSVNVTLSNSFGFGGHNACLMLRKYRDDA